MGGGNQRHDILLLMECKVEYKNLDKRFLLICL